MKPFVLTLASTVTCAHGGAVTVTPPGTAKLHVQGQSVLLAADLTAATLACPAVTAGQVVQCVKVTSVMDEATPAKLTVAGASVLRDSLNGLTNGTPPTLAGIAGQTKLSTT